MTIDQKATRPSHHDDADDHVGVPWNAWIERNDDAMLMINEIKSQVQTSLTEDWMNVDMKCIYVPHFN